MHPITVTLTFDSLTAAAEALGLLDYAAQPPTIRYEDRPDVGATPLPVLPAAPITPPARPSLPRPSLPSLDEMFPAPAAPEAAITPVPTPAAVAPSVPVAPFPPAPPAASPPETATGRDSEGLPWDARIHASNKSTNQDGTWRQKRGLNDPSLKGRVEAELRAGMNAPVLTPETALASVLPSTPPSTPPAPTPPTAATVAPTAAPVASLPPPPAPPAPAPAPTDAAPTVASFLARISPLLTADKTVTVKLNQALTAAGLTGIGALLGNPAHLGTVSAVFDSLMAETA